MAFFLAACLLPAFLVSLAATGAVRRIAPRLGLIDRPAARKVHTTPTPLGGGVAIWLGTVLPIAVAVAAAYASAHGLASSGWLPERLAVHAPGVLTQLPRVAAILAAGTLLAAVGLCDDFRPLPWPPRLALQFLAAFLVVGAGVRVTLLAEAPWLGALGTAFWVVLLVNSFNFLDNMNGLSAGIAAIASAVLAALMLTALPDPQWFVAGAALILAGSLAGFLVHNWRGRIFMGDSGSYFVGLMMATLTAVATFYEPRAGGGHVVLAPLCLLAIPLYDLASVIAIRLKHRRSPFQPDKSHFSHRLVELGLTPRRAVLTIHLATLTTGLAALVLYQVPGWPGAGLVLTIVGCVLAIVAILETTGRRTGRRLSAASSAPPSNSPPLRSDAPHDASAPLRP